MLNNGHTQLALFPLFVQSRISNAHTYQIGEEKQFFTYQSPSQDDSDLIMSLLTTMGCDCSVTAGTAADPC